MKELRERAAAFSSVNSLLLRTVLASLPLLGLSLQARAGFAYGVLCAFLLLLATLIFLAVRAIIPETVHRISFMLLLLVFGVIAAETSRLSPLFLPGLFLLPYPENFRRGLPWPRVLGKAVAAGLSLWALLTTHGVFSQVLGLGWGIRFFQLPAGSYLLLGLGIAALRKK